MIHNEQDRTVVEAVDGRLFNSKSVELVRELLNADVKHRTGQGFHQYRLLSPIHHLVLTHFTNPELRNKPFAAILEYFLSIDAGRGLYVGILNIDRISLGNRDVEFITDLGEKERAFRLDIYGSIYDGNRTKQE